tara:strand:+ start:7964 stop:8239 length:276 start_codon:yes stop_codon:yes gene_type:complete
MNIYRINTTAFEEEDFYLMTDLTEEEITSVITPIVMAERNREDVDEESDNDSIVSALNDTFYENGDLESALSQKYPNNVIEMYYDFDKITI